MKYAMGQFTNEYYKLWQMGLAIPISDHASIYSVKFRKNHFDEYSRITLKAMGISDALERACYAITYASPWRPEDIDLQAVYDSEENLIWVDEPFYDLIQKKNEFRGMGKREFLKKFGATTAAILYGFRPSIVRAGTTTTALSGTATGFIVTGEQLYTTPGSYTWTAPVGVTSVCVVAVGGGGGGCVYAPNNMGGGGGALVWKNNIAVVSGNAYSAIAGAGGSAHSGAGTFGTAGGSSSFNAIMTAGGGGIPSAATPAVGGLYSGAGTSGGNGGNGSGPYTGNPALQLTGGGGAGGYAGNGGQAGGYDQGATTVGQNGAGGGGGGGVQHEGGGVGLFGQGSNGAGANPVVTGFNDGEGGSGGDHGRNGGKYGGGGKYSGAGSGGAVRILWGPGRSFPSSAT